MLRLATIAISCSACLIGGYAIAIYDAPLPVNTSTLYRNSPGMSDLGLPDTRVQVASFNLDDGSGYNHRECDRVARLLNANAQAQGVGTVHWCEPGAYSKDGPIPVDVESDFPAWPR